MKTPYGELNVGDVFFAADGSGGSVEVADVDTYADVEDVVVRNRDGYGDEYRMDWFKLMMVRYSKEN